MILGQRPGWLVLAAALCAGAPAFAQEKPEEVRGYGVTVTSVTLAVTVQDGRGRYVNDLAQADFTVTENGVPRSITRFSHDFNAPLSLTILLDVSGSMALQDKMAECRSSLGRFVADLLKPSDEAALLIFADGEVEVASGYSEDKTRLLEVLARTEAYGKTALNDAVAASPEYARKGRHEKKALLLVTDGIENDSQYSPSQAAEVARKVDVPIYTVGYKIPLDEQYLSKHKRAPGLTSAGIVESLESFSRATGGKAFFANTPVELAAALGEVRRETGHQYILGYTSHSSLEGGFTSIKVLTKNRKHRVRAREGY
ncbi:MAG TPA: VWA domain-containing protein [Acidobacteriota bacterium]|nr:VWA domain-containing protein [Acidobacteriota bacterium]